MEGRLKEVELSRDMGLFTITMIGVGAMIGAGIFVLTGIAAGVAGPGLVLAFLLNGIVTLFTAMVYAELGSAMPEAGGGYLWIKESLPSANGFLSGWMSWFAHAVAGSLYALGFGAYFLYLLSGFGIEPSIEEEILKKILAVFIALIFIYINFRGASEAGMAGNIVTVLKILIIGIFILSGLYKMYFDPSWRLHFKPFLPNEMGGIFMAMGLTYIAFEGYEIIVQAGEEVRNPKKNIPKAVFFSLAIVIPIYILVAITAIGALECGELPTWQCLSEFGEVGIAKAAEQFMPLGGPLILFGGLLSTMSALNATTFSSTRVSFAMGRDFNLPSVFRRVHPKNRTPYTSLLISGALIIFMAVALPIEDVASAADIMFLLLFLQVNVAVLRIRKKMGKKLDYGFKVPLFPYIPYAAIIMQLFLAVYMYYYSPVAWASAFLWVAVGTVVYFAYSLSKEKVEKGKISRRIAPEKYRIIVPINDPDYLTSQMTIASAIALPHRSEVVALHVVEIPYQTFLEVGRKFVSDRMPMLDQAVKVGMRYGVEVRKKISISHDVSQTVIDLAHTGKGNVIVIGWSGRIYETKVRRSVAQKVLRDVLCDVCILKPRNFGKISRILVPIDTEEHYKRLEIAESLAIFFGAEIRLLGVVLKDGKQRKKMERILSEDASSLKVGVEERVVRGVLVEKILEESKDCELIVIGPSRDWLLSHLLFGSVPDKIFNEARCTVLMVKEPEQKIESFLRMALKRIFEVFRK
ncbi:MAG: amino acid permease [Candidatus Methanofastidiosia archaeon]